MPIPKPCSSLKSFAYNCLAYSWIALGSFLAALAIEVFLIPNQLIDGGIVGVSLILARLYGDNLLSIFYILLTIPFAYLAYKHIRRSFLLHMLFAAIFFAVSLHFCKNMPNFTGDSLEIIVFGGGILGIGVGLVIRYGGCLDGTEIVAILINRKKGFTVGQVVLVLNIFIFGAYGLIFKDWHIALQSLMTYFVAYKMMDLVIVGLDDLKSVMIISSKPTQLADSIMTELGLGLTVMHGKGGFSGEAKDILYVIVERLDLSDLKELILNEDPAAFIAIENLHEVVYGTHPNLKKKNKNRTLTKSN